MEIRKLEIDIDQGILRINGKDYKDRKVVVFLPGPDGWPLQMLFNKDQPPEPEEAHDELKTSIRSVDSQGRTVEEIHHQDGSVERITYMGHSVEKCSMEEKILEICYKLFWPVLIMWCIAALAKIVLMFV